jgi:hypothetical protein
MATRSMTRLALAFGVLAGLSGLRAAHAQTPKWEGDPARVQIELRLFMPVPWQAEAYSPGLPNDTLDLAGTVGVQEKNTPELRFCYMPSPRSRLRLGWLHTRFDGENVVDGSFNFNGTDFGRGAAVTGNVNQDYFYLNWAYEPIEIGEDTFRAGFVLGLHGWLSEIRMYNSAPQVSTTKDFNNVFPAIGLAMDWAPWKFLTVFFEGSGANQGANGWHLDVEGGVKFCPIKLLAIVASYRQLEISNMERDSDVFGRWTIRGPYAGVDFRF